MPAKILPFVEKELYFQEHLDTPDLTTLELFDRLYEVSCNSLAQMIRNYKSTGGWNKTAEKLMQRVSEDTKAICASVAGERKNGKN